MNLPKESMAFSFFFVQKFKKTGLHRCELLIFVESRRRIDWSFWEKSRMMKLLKEF